MYMNFSCVVGRNRELRTLQFSVKVYSVEVLKFDF